MLRSRDFSYFHRLQLAANNAPPMRQMERGEPVQAIQRALSDLGYQLPRSFALGVADGIYGRETIDAIRQFQLRERLMCDGVAGSSTLHLLDEYLCVQYFHQSSMNTLLTRGATVLCPHGAQVVMPVPRFGPALTPEDTYVIAGCAFPNRCCRVKWTVANKRIRFNGHDTLDQTSIGLCLDLHGNPNGPAIIVNL